MAAPQFPPAVLRPRRILVRGVNWLGDAVMTTPALQRLREAQPQACITLVTPEKLGQLWTHHPAIDDLITFAPHEGARAVAEKIRTWPALGRVAESSWSARGAGAASALARARRWFSLRREFRSAPFDLALVLPNSPRSALEVWLARIPHRIGFARPWRNGFLTQAIPARPERVAMRKRTPSEIRRLIAAARLDPPIGHRPSPIAHPPAHQMHEYLHLVAALGANPEPVAPFLGVTTEEVEAARRRFGLEASRRWLGLVPGAEYGPAKRWPKQSFIVAAAELQRRVGCGLVLFGSQADVPLAWEIESAIGTPPSPVRNLAGRTTLRELCAALKVCDAALTNDTGPMHVAAAVGTPVVVPFGSTAPELTGPGLPGDPRHRLLKSDAPCAPCFRRECPIDFRCMNGIQVHRAVVAVMEALATGESSDAGERSGP